jgi:hypothetical protein
MIRPTPRQHLEGRLQIIGADPIAGGAELMTNELQPQLGGLVLDDEQHLVVLSRPGTLRREELIEREVVAIAHLAAAEVDVRALVRGPRPLRAATAVGGWFGYRVPLAHVTAPRRWAT